MRANLVVLCLSCVLFASQARGQDHEILVRDLREEESPRALLLPESLPLPAYPSEMLRINVEGDATLRFLVQEDGSVSDVAAIAGTQKEFCEPAREAVTHWRFRKPEKALWMRCLILFRMSEEDGGPMGFPGYTETQLCGREVLKLATERVKKEGINLGNYTGWRYPQFIVYGENGLRWSVTWMKQNENGSGGWGDQFIRVWVDDKTRETRLDEKKKPNKSTLPTPTVVTPAAAAPVAPPSGAAGR